MGRLISFPCTLDQANGLIKALHRHHDPVQGHRFSIGCMNDKGELLGAAVIGRPVGRETNQWYIAEVTRLVSNGEKNVCTFLYSAAARACKEMGFLKIQTFILESETGFTLKLSGWCFEQTSDGGDWSGGGKRKRNRNQPEGPKQRWGKVLNDWDLNLLEKIESPLSAEDMGL